MKNRYLHDHILDDIARLVKSKYSNTEVLVVLYTEGEKPNSSIGGDMCPVCAAEHLIDIIKHNNLKHNSEHTETEEQVH